jgi:DNA-binding CsgD family transcriptional regulator
MSGGDQRVALRDALSGGGVDAVRGAVREEIAASWQRSSSTGLRPDRLEVPHDPDLDRDALLVGAAGPVLDQLADDLVSTRISVVLTDERAHVLDRRVSDRGLHARLDGIFLAPGFVYAEERIGTNAIGTALAQGGPSFVDGIEHFADALTAMACAAAPIIDPHRGRILGAIDLTAGADDAGPLMLPLARRAAREIEQRLVDDARIADRLLLQRFLRARRGAKGPLVIVNGRTMITNAAADRLVGPGDEARLWDCATQLLRGGDGEQATIVLAGASVVVRGEPVFDGGEVLGALLRLTPGSPDGGAPPMRMGSRPPFGWSSVTDTERSVIDLVAQGLTNREVGERLFVSPHTVDFHLRAIFRKLDVRSRVELTRLVLEHEAGRTAPT